MAWTDQHRANAHPHPGRYPTDLTDEEWALLKPLIPPAKRGGRPRQVDMREVLNAMFYILSAGCQWRMLPKDFPSKTTVYTYFSDWRHTGRLQQMHDLLVERTRVGLGRNPEPSLSAIDSQSVLSAAKGGVYRMRSATTRARRSAAANAI